MLLPELFHLFFRFLTVRKIKRIYDCYDPMIILSENVLSEGCVVGHAFWPYMLTIFLVSTNSKVHETHDLHVSSMIYVKPHFNDQVIKATAHILFHNLEIFFSHTLR